MLLKTLRRLYSQEQPQLSNYLQQHLQRQALWPLRDAQKKVSYSYSEVLKLAEQQPSNIFINQIDGAGKTLAYLLPILQRQLTRTKDGTPHGAIIVTLSKELALQIYRQIRLLDQDNKLKVMRSGSITHYSPVVEQMCKPAKDQNMQLIVEQMEKNTANSIKWKSTDILITTPKMLYRILSIKSDRKENVTPEYLVIDEADSIAKNRDLSTYVNKNIDYLNTFLGENNKLKYVVVAPERGSFEEDSKLRIPASDQFQYTNHVTEESLITTLNLLYVRIPKQNREEVMEAKSKALVRLLNARSGKRIVIYCEKESMETIKKAITTQTDLKFQQIQADMSTEQRMLALFNFNQGTEKILISTDVTSKGTCFHLPINTIISFDAKDPSQEISRLCRTNNPNAQYIMLLTQAQIQKAHLWRASSLGPLQRYIPKPSELTFLPRSEKII